jgi:WD40 repeat protein
MPLHRIKSNRIASNRIASQVGNGVRIVSMRKSHEVGDDGDLSVWYVQDGAGAVWTVDLSHALITKQPKRILHFHAGAVSGVATCSVAHFAATVGADGAVRIHDYSKRVHCVAARPCATAASSVHWGSTAIDSTGRTLFVGHADGVLRVYNFSHGPKGPTALVLCKAWRPHTDALKLIAESPDGRTVATSNGATIFFFFCDKGALTPLGYVELPAPANSLRFSSDGARVLLACSGGVVAEVATPHPADIDNSKTFHIKNLKTLMYVVNPVLEATCWKIPPPPPPHTPTHTFHPPVC